MTRTRIAVGILLLTAISCVLSAYAQQPVDYQRYLAIMEQHLPIHDVYSEACDVLRQEARKRNEVVVELLMNSLSSSSSEYVRGSSARLLGSVKYFSEDDMPARAIAETVYHALRTALDTETRVPVKGMIANSLGRVGVPAAIPILKQLVHHSEIERHNAIMTGQPLSDVVGKGEDAVPLGAIGGLGSMARLRAEHTEEILLFFIDEVKLRLKEDDPRQFVTSALLRQVCQIDDRRGLDVVIEASHHKDKWVRLSAAKSLGRLALVGRYPSDEPRNPGIPPAHRIASADRQRAESRLMALSHGDDSSIRKAVRKALTTIREADAKRDTTKQNSVHKQ